ncbi:hypothetical protein [Rhodobacter sp. NSM]|uniref:hypothetical protein n=1 Tax=Rhodobacter sp. NSM TaxID=3457501 RepID=UPI003FD08A97
MTKTESMHLDALIERAKKVTMTAEQATAQRRSFAYGNSAFENPAITMRMVEEEGDRLGL